MSRRIAIAVDKDGDIARISPSFGESHTYLIVDPDTGEIIQEKGNQPELRTHPQGIKEAMALKSSNVEKVISHEYGPWAYAFLDDQNIETLLVDSDVSPDDALTLLRYGVLRKYYQVTV